MKKKLLIVSALAAAVLVGGAGAASASTSPGGGPAFGQHVSSMTPEHAQAERAGFGRCVSTMARTGECDH